jgi:hypothetical protein
MDKYLKSNLFDPFHALELLVLASIHTHTHTLTGSWCKIYATQVWVRAIPDFKIWCIIKLCKRKW